MVFEGPQNLLDWDMNIVSWWYSFSKALLISFFFFWSTGHYWYLVVHMSQLKWTTDSNLTTGLKVSTEIESCCKPFSTNLNFVLWICIILDSENPFWIHHIVLADLLCQTKLGCRYYYAPKLGILLLLLYTSMDFVVHLSLFWSCFHHWILRLEDSNIAFSGHLMTQL